MPRMRDRPVLDRLPDRRRRGGRLRAARRRSPASPTTRASNRSRSSPGGRRSARSSSSPTPRGGSAGAARSSRPWRLPRGARAALAIAALMRPRPERRDVLRVRPDDRRDRPARASTRTRRSSPSSPSPAATSALDAIRVAALAWRSAAWSSSSPAASIRRRGVRVEPLGIGLALVAALSQTVFVTISRAGYPQLPTEQAMAWILGDHVVACVVSRDLGGGDGPLDAAAPEPSAPRPRGVRRHRSPPASRRSCS